MGTTEKKKIRQVTRVTSPDGEAMTPDVFAALQAGAQEPPDTGPEQTGWRKFELVGFDRRPVLMVTSPSLRGYNHNTQVGPLLKDERLSRFRIDYHGIPHTVIDVARNQAVFDTMQYYGGLPEFIVMIDDDIDCSRAPSVIGDLVEFLETGWRNLPPGDGSEQYRCEKPPEIVGVPLPWRQSRFDPNFNPMDFQNPPNMLQPAKVETVGAGLIVCRGSVFRKIAPPWFVNTQFVSTYRDLYGEQWEPLYKRWTRNGGKPLQFFEHLLHYGGEGEDFFFCHRLRREAGIDIWIDPRPEVGHNGGTIYGFWHDHLVHPNRQALVDKWRENRDTVVPVEEKVTNG